MTRRIVVPKIIDRLDQAGTEKLPPQTIDRGTGEKGIVGFREPVRQSGTGADLVLPARLAAVEKTRLGNAWRIGDQEFAPIRRFGQNIIDVFDRTDAGKE